MMAKIPKFQIGAVYAVQTQEQTYYFRLLQGGRCAFFAPFLGEINEENLKNVPYQLYISCNSYAIKKEFWQKILPSPNIDKDRWESPILANFSNFTLVHHFETEDFKVWKTDGELYPIEKEVFIKMVQAGQILHIFDNYKSVEKFLDTYYCDYPNSYLFDPQMLLMGNDDYKKQYQEVLQKLRDE